MIKEVTMKSVLFRLVVASILFVISSTQLNGQRDDWTQPFPGHRVIGSLYAVGTYGLGVFLITSKKGHILINTGFVDSTVLIQDNIESLGFKLKDVKILLTMQAHRDHTADLARIKQLTGAKMLATKADARVLEDGGFSDPNFGGSVLFKPVSVDKIIKEGDVIALGSTKLTVHEHPGHTEGSSSYTMKIHENNRDYNVAIVNMATINRGKNLVVNPTYPGIADDFAKTFRHQKSMNVDVWVAGHGGQYGLHEKYKAGQAYSSETFVDSKGYIAAVERLEKLYFEQLKQERLQK